MINKKIYLLVALLSGMAFCFFASCGDDNNSYEIDEVWKSFNDSLYNSHRDSLERKNSGDYIDLECLSQNGTLFYKKSTMIEPTTPPSKRASEIGLKISKDGNPYPQDSVVVRYIGWYYTKNTDGSLKRIVFDATENIDGFDYNKDQGVGMRVNGSINGFSTMLQYMDVKDNNQVLVVIPYQLAYGAYGKSSTTANALGYTISIPGYTTLYFNILLQEIIPVNPDEFPDVDLGGLKK